MVVVQLKFGTQDILHNNKKWEYLKGDIKHRCDAVGTKRQEILEHITGGQGQTDMRS